MFVIQARGRIMKFKVVLVLFVLSLAVNIFYLNRDYQTSREENHLLGTYVANVANQSKVGRVQYQFTFASDGSCQLYADNKTILKGRYEQVDEGIYQLTSEGKAYMLRSEVDHFFFPILDEKTMLRFELIGRVPSYFAE